MATEPTDTTAPESRATDRDAYWDKIRAEPIDVFLDRLPVRASVVSRHLGDAPSDDVLQAWAWGIEDVRARVQEMISEWRKGQTP